MLINRQQARLHGLFAVPAVALMAVAIIFYLWQSHQAGEWLRGSSAAGLFCGVLAGLITAFEMLLWPRKVYRRLRLGPMKYWMAAHIWFGLVALPLAICHCGFHLGGRLPTTLLTLFVFTVVSGVYGLVLQNILPRWMLRHIPSETIYSQIDYVSEQVVQDLRHMLIAACGPWRQRSVEIPIESIEEVAEAAPVAVVGAQRQAGRTWGRTRETRDLPDASVDAQHLWTAFDEISPFLKFGRSADSPLTEPQKAAPWFDRLRSVCSPQSATIIDIFEQMCEQRREFDTQQRVHRWLHHWIPLHLGLSVAVSVLLIAHIWTAIRFW